MRGLGCLSLHLLHSLQVFVIAYTGFYLRYFNKRNEPFTPNNSRLTYLLGVYLIEMHEKTRSSRQKAGVTCSFS